MLLLFLQSMYAWESEGSFPGLAINGICPEVAIKIFPGGAKVVKFNFFFLKLKNDIFC